MVKARYDDAEHAALTAAAARAGLTAAGVLAKAGLSVAGHGPPPSQTADRELLAEVLRLRTVIRRYAVNVNQAVTVLHSTGQAPFWLSQAVDGADLRRPQRRRRDAGDRQQAASVIGKVCKRGSDVRRLLGYLFREAWR